MQVSPPPSKLSFTIVAGGTTHDSSGTTAWHDWDLSATIPAGAVAAQFYITEADAAHMVGIRPNGSAITPRWTIRAAGGTISPIVELGSDRIVELYFQDNNATSYAELIGYWS